MDRRRHSQPPAELEQAEERQRDQDERERGALAGDDPQQHADGHGAQPHAHADRDEGSGPLPVTGGQQADRCAGGEGPEGIPQAGQAAPGVMVHVADHHEEQHAAEIGKTSASRTHGDRLVVLPKITAM